MARSSISLQQEGYLLVDCFDTEEQATARANIYREQGYQAYIIEDFRYSIWIKPKEA